MADVDPSDAASVSTFAVTAAVGAIIILIALMCSVVRGNKDKSENGWSFICVLTDSPVLLAIAPSLRNTMQRLMTWQSLLDIKL